VKRLIKKFGKYNVTTFIIMGVGVILFLLTPLLIWLFDFDSDILGFLIFIIGLVMWIVGLIVRKVRRNKSVMKIQTDGRQDDGWWNEGKGGPDPYDK
jgi:predicted membrane channel-forming protein YqfA (hemolysin III family)